MSKAKENTDIQSSVTRFLYKYFRCHTFRKTRFHVYLLNFTVSVL